MTTQNDKFAGVSTPFRYIGGKKWLRKTLRREVDASLFGAGIHTYVEPFCGALGSFLNIHDILHKHGVKKVVLNDINRSLVNFYRAVNENHLELVRQFMLLESAFGSVIPVAAREHHANNAYDKVAIDSLLGENPGEFFKQVRSNFNRSKASADMATSYAFAAELMFLQKHCFNGVYRENSRGDYNVPFNRTPNVFKEADILGNLTNIKRIFDLFETEISLKPFDAIHYGKNTLYYLDPPYVSSGSTAGENKYHAQHFGEEQQQKLIDLIAGTHFIYSNHDNEEIKARFGAQAPCRIDLINRKNIMSSTNESRAVDKVEMLVIHNPVY